MLDVVTNEEKEPPDSIKAQPEEQGHEQSGKNERCSSIKEFRERFYARVPDEKWNDWRWQIAHRIKDADEMEHMFGHARAQALPLGKGLPVAATPYYVGVAATSSSEGIRRCIEPTVHEFMRSPQEADDPLGEEGHTAVPGLVHRYPDRVLFLVTDYCSTYCRYCTRSRLVGRKKHSHSRRDWKRAIAYIREHGEIRDVLLSGGDPLTLPDDKLDWLLTELRGIEHVEMIRIGTKVPAVLPQRITPELTAMLRKHHPLFMSLHFAHPDELTGETMAACTALADAGIPLGSQTVLLKGVNDDVQTMKRLMQGLLRMRVRPYYLYQCDPIPGSGHFRTRVEKGLEIISGLRGHTSGYAVPSYVIDAPGGGGKIPLLPESVVGREDSKLLLRNYEGGVFEYPETEAAETEYCIARN